jgi:hypothetical protein
MDIMALQITQNTKVGEITPDVIKDLLNNDNDEDLYFDFKAGIESTEVDKVHSIRKSFATFANTLGGFLFLGVLDKSNKEGKTKLDRIVGLSDTKELGKRITQKYLDKGLAIPIISFEEIKIINVDGKDVAVVKIPKSEKRPHAIKKAQDTPLEFWARGSGTARAMDYTHLLLEIDQSKEERGWINALYLDLESVIAISKQNIAQAGKNDSLPNKYNSIISKESGNLLRVLSNDVKLMRHLFPLRQQIALADDQRDRLSAQSVLPMSDMAQIITNGNNDMAERGKQIEANAVKAMDYLFENYPSARELVTQARSIA